tara:strand:+ start:733 stop:969 length:237 start_codon:yes stop_codon:yes gene_type:complete
MTKLSDEEQLIVDDYFEYTILEIQEGIPKYVLEDVLDHYKDLEDYLPCAGIKKALDWYDTNSYVRDMYTIDEITKEKQ